MFCRWKAKIKYFLEASKYFVEDPTRATGGRSNDSSEMLDTMRGVVMWRKTLDVGGSTTGTWCQVIADTRTMVNDIGIVTALCCITLHTLIVCCCRPDMALTAVWWPVSLLSQVGVWRWPLSRLVMAGLLRAIAGSVAGGATLSPLPNIGTRQRARHPCPGIAAGLDQAPAHLYHGHWYPRWVHGTSLRLQTLE